MEFFKCPSSMFKRCMGASILLALCSLITSYGFLSARGKYAVIPIQTEAEFFKDFNLYSTETPQLVSQSKSTKKNGVANELQMLSENAVNSVEDSWLESTETPSEYGDNSLKSSWLDATETPSEYEDNSLKSSWLDAAETPFEKEDDPVKSPWLDSTTPRASSTPKNNDRRLDKNDTFAASERKSISYPLSSPPNIISEPNTHKSILYKSVSVNLPDQVDTQTVHKTSPVQVVIVTTKRSGSSFVGELFNANPYVFYVYEPLYLPMEYVLNHPYKNDQFERIAHDVWNHTLRCNFSTDYPPSSSWLMRGETSFDSCKSITAIKRSSLLCPVKQISDLKIGPVVSRLCRDRPYTVLKTIRVQDISQLKTFVQDPGLNVKILHLVRDPRAVMNSRWRLNEQNSDLLRRKGRGADEILDLCDHMQRNLAFESSPPEWLRDRYIRVRFEDIAGDLIGETKRIYDQLGMQLHDDVVSWIQENTHGNSKYQSKTNPFSRTRDTEKVIDDWKNKLPPSLIKRIETTCREVMNYLSYERVT